MMAEVNWRRVFAVSFLVVALILVSGSIYLHVQQKHHLGRLRHSHSRSSGSGSDSENNAGDESAVAAIVGDSELTAAASTDAADTTKSDSPTIILYHWDSRTAEVSEEKRLYTDLLGAINKLTKVFLPKSAQQQKGNESFYVDASVEGSADNLYRKMITSSESESEGEEYAEAIVESNSEQHYDDYHEYGFNNDNDAEVNEYGTAYDEYFSVAEDVPHKRGIK